MEDWAVCMGRNYNGLLVLIAVFGIAFAAWKLGRWVGYADGQKDESEKIISNLEEMITENQREKLTGDNGNDNK